MTILSSRLGQDNTSSAVSEGRFTTIYFDFSTAKRCFHKYILPSNVIVYFVNVVAKCSFVSDI